MNKEKQKKLLIDIMEADGKDGLYETQQIFTADDLKAAYNTGYLDGQTNHINDAENYVNQQCYIKSEK